MEIKVLYRREGSGTGELDTLVLEVEGGKVKTMRIHELRRKKDGVIYDTPQNMEIFNSKIKP